jgi:cytochrome c553
LARAEVETMKVRWRVTGIVLAVVAFLAGAEVLSADPKSGHGSTALPEESRGLFLEKCSRCHEPERAYGVITDRTLWARTIASMALRDRAWIPSGTVRRILDYSIYYRPYQRSVFRSYCGGCHDWKELRSLRKNEAQWRTCITYMAQRHGGEITREEIELLVCGLQEPI